MSKDNSHESDYFKPPAVNAEVVVKEYADVRSSDESFIKSDKGWVEQVEQCVSSNELNDKDEGLLAAFSEPIVVDSPIRMKQRKNRTRRSSVALRQDLRNALEMLYPLESANLMDRPIIQLHKGVEKSRETHHMGNVNIASLWRASARHLVILSEELEGSKGFRYGEDEFDDHRHKEFASVKDARVCRCLFKDSVEVQWSMKWGAYTRQCAFKPENQDGWVAVVPSDAKMRNRFLSDRSDDPENKQDSATQKDFITYNGITNYNAEAACRSFSTSVLIPKIDLTLFSSQASILEAQYLHSTGSAWPSLDLKTGTGSKRKRRGSLHVIRQMLIGDRDSARDHLPDPRDVAKALNMSKQKAEASCWSLQSESGPLSSIVRITNQKAFDAEWQRVDAGANYPSKLSTGTKGSSEFLSVQAVDDDVHQFHQGSIVSPLQPAVIVCMDGHGSGGKLGVARAATTMAEALSLSLSCISWLGGVGGFTDSLSHPQIREEINNLLVRAELDVTIGSEESLVFDGLGVNMNPKNTLCTCRSDAQILNHMTLYRGSKSGIPTADMTLKSKNGMPTAETTAAPLKEKEPKIACLNRATLEATRQLMINSLSVAFRLAHSRLLEENDLMERDFGTTACAMAIAGRYLYAAWVGDSPGCLVAIKNNRIGVIRLTHEHCLKNIYEKERIKTWTGPSQVDQKMQQRRARRNSRGHILETQHAGHRLIPEGVSYHESRCRGLSINMSRALGHNQLTYCALSPQPEFACIDLLYCLQRMKWFTGPKANEAWENEATSNRLFHNANTLKNIEVSDEAIEENSTMFHIKPDPAPIGVTRDKDELYSVPSPDMCKAFGGLELYVCAYTDGIGDCLNPAIVGAEIYRNRLSSCIDIARRLTERAEEIRSVYSLNRDNCAMIVSKLKLDSFIPVGGKSSKGGSGTAGTNAKSPVPTDGPLPNPFDTSST